MPYDAVLVVSFGGPEGPDDVVPFLENVTRGRGIPRERLAEVGAHYAMFGGKSPINDQCRALIAALSDELARSGPALPIYWGNRNWHPMVEDTVRQMAGDGVRRAVLVPTSLYSSYSSCRQYLAAVEAARAAVGAAAPEFDVVDKAYDRRGFIDPMIDNTLAAITDLPDPLVLFCAHSIPTSMAAASDYERQLRRASEQVMAGVAERAAGKTAGRAHDWKLVFQSRSGAPTQPWLEPDVSDAIRAARAEGAASVVLVPIGFISDHMEVVYDLDVVAAATAAEVGIELRRAATVGIDPRFVGMLRDLIVERATTVPATCGLQCCPAATVPSSGTTRRG